MMNEERTTPDDSLVGVCRKLATRIAEYEESFGMPTSSSCHAGHELSECGKALREALAKAGKDLKGVAESEVNEKLDAEELSNPEKLIEMTTVIQVSDSDCRSHADWTGKYDGTTDIGHMIPHKSPTPGENSPPPRSIKVVGRDLRAKRTTFQPVD